MQARKASTEVIVLLMQVGDVVDVVEHIELVDDVLTRFRRLELKQC